LTDTKSNDVITSIDQITTAWLTAVLSRSGALTRGAVAAFDVDAGRGVRGYSWQQLYDDYRLCAAMGVYVAVEYCGGGINERWISAWLMMLQRSLTSCDDLDCRALWKEAV
jgi:hypothetical protein